jgi:hypothetical protein
MIKHYQVYYTDISVRDLNNVQTDQHRTQVHFKLTGRGNCLQPINVVGGGGNLE